MKNTKKGFTLVELLVVIAILAILATVSVVGYTSFIDRANKSNAETEAHQIATEISSFLMIDKDYVIPTMTKDADLSKVDKETVVKVYAVKEDNAIVIKATTAKCTTAEVKDGSGNVTTKGVWTYVTTSEGIPDSSNYTGDIAKWGDFVELPGFLWSLDGKLIYVYEVKNPSEGEYKYTPGDSYVEVFGD